MMRIPHTARSFGRFVLPARFALLASPARMADSISVEGDTPGEGGSQTRRDAMAHPLTPE